MAERGSVLPAVLALGFGVLLLFGVAMDLSRWSSSHREVALTADAAAQAGAAMVEPSGLRSGDLTVDAASAETAASLAATNSRPRSGRTVAVSIVGSEVCVLVTQPFHSGLLDALGVGPELVKARSCAAPARG